MSDYKALIDVFKNKTVTAVNDPNITVVLSHESHKPTLRQPYVRITLLPSESIPITQGKDSMIEHTGLAQIDVITPSGTDVHFDIVDNIVNEFNGKRQNGILNIDRSWAGSMNIEPDWSVSPVFCRWSYYIDSVGLQDI